MKESGETEEDGVMEAHIGVVPLLAGNHEPRNADSLWKLEKTRNWFSLTASKKTHSTDTDFSPLRLISDFEPPEIYDDKFVSLSHHLYYYWLQQQ